MSNHKKGGTAQPPRAPRLADSHDAKLHPYAIQATFRGIQTQWKVPPGKAASTKEDFAAETKEIFDALHEKYKKNRRSSHESLIESCQDGSRALRYIDLRYYAECARVPTSVLYVFTHVVGDVARNGDKQGVLNLIDAIAAAIEALRSEVLLGGETPEQLKSYFHTPRPRDEFPPRYEVKIDRLRSMSDAYNKVRDPRYKPDSLTG